MNHSAPGLPRAWVLAPADSRSSYDHHHLGQASAFASRRGPLPAELSAGPSQGQQGAARIDVDLASQPAALSLTGEYDLATAGMLTSTLDWLLEVCADRLVVDVSGIEFIDSSGADPLLRAQRGAAQRAGAMELRGSSPALTRLLDALGRMQLLDVPPTERRS